MKTSKFSRRQFLQGMMGALIPMPFLQSLAPRELFAATEVAPRLVGIRSIYGQVPQLYYPFARPTVSKGNNVFHRPFSQNEVISQLIGESFKPIAHKLSLLRGLDQGQGGHNETNFMCAGSFSTVSNSNRFPTFPNSMDEVIARSAKVYPQEPVVRNLRIVPAVKSNSIANGNRHSWWGQEKLPYEWNMQTVVDNIFKGLPSNDPKVQAKIDKKLKAVDMAREDFNKVRNGRKISSEDKQRLEDYVDHLNDIENKLNVLKNYTCNDNMPVDTTDFKTIYRSGSDIMIAALSCGLTRVANFSAPDFGKLAGENGSDFHGKSHWTFKGSILGEVNADGDEYLVFNPGDAVEATYMRFYKFVMEEVAYVMNQMDQIVESNGKTMLDNSLVVFGNEQGGASSHDRHSMPLLIGGTAGGKVEPGYWDYRLRPYAYYAGRKDIYPSPGRPYNNFLITLGKIMGLDSADWELNGEAGFGTYEFSKFKYTFKQTKPTSKSLTAMDVYGRFLTDEEKRKALEGWYLG
jgi:hypothetical protein